MNASWENDPAFAEFRAMALKLEAAVTATNDVLLKLGGLEPEKVVESFADMQAKLLGFDEHARRRFQDALEDKRVKTLGAGNVFMTCVLSSAVALSEFKKQPQLAGGSGWLAQRLDKLRAHSTNGLSLAAFVTTSFYAVMGNGAWGHLAAYRAKKPEVTPDSATDKI